MFPDSPTNLWRGIEIKLLKQRWGRYFQGKILDLGCGEGEVAKLVFNKGQSFVKELWGLDNDPEMVKKAQKSGVYSRVILGDARKIKLQNNSVDLVFSNSVLEYIQDIEAVLEEVGRVLKPGGYLVATMPSDKLGEYLGWGKIYAWWFNRKYHHYHLYSLAKWEKLLIKRGLKLIDSKNYLGREEVKYWHKLLWLNKLGISRFYSRQVASGFGAAIAILGRKI